MNHPKQISRFTAPVAAAVALALAGCASTPSEPQSLVEARATVETAVARNGDSGPARDDVDLARKELRAAEDALGKSKKDMEYHAYVARQSARTAIERNDSAALREKVKSAETERAAVLLEAREREAAMAEHRAQTAAAEAARVAAIAQRESQQLAQTRQQLAAANSQIEDLKAQNTERGMVLTLGDVLFDSGSATLKPGADQSLQRVADFLARNDGAKVRVEGHTDSAGDESYNQLLSQRRAESVAARLAQLGVDNARITAMGLGETYPVTGNATSAGRQQNRRVEIVFSDLQGQFVASSERARLR